MKKKKAKTGLIILLIIFGIGISGFVLGEEYFVGEVAKFDLKDFGEYVAYIKTPLGQYVQKTDNPFFVLELEYEGNYSLKINSDKGSKSFFLEVLDKENTLEEESKVLYTKIENLNYSFPKVPESIRKRDKILLESDRIVVGKDVKWVYKKFITTKKNIDIEIPKNANNISVEQNGNKINYLEKKSFGFGIMSFEYLSKNRSIALKDIQGEIKIEYITPAPKIEEKKISETKKEVKVISENHYENVLSFTRIDEELKITNPRILKVYWVEENLFLDSKSYDTNNNGYIDYLEWNISHLSNQTFIIEIIAAEHLDENKTFIENIYEVVRFKDDNWTFINDSHYVRVTFEEELNNSNDITIYAKSNDTNATIEVYYFNTSQKITSFENIDSENYYQVLLTSLNGSHDTFDLKIIGNIEIDHIIDPRTLTDSVLSSNDSNIKEGDPITISGIYSGSGSGGPSSWVIGLRDANNLINIDASCSNGEIFEVDSIDLSSCGQSGGESCTNNGDGSVSLTLKGTTNTIIWTITSCINSSLNSPVNLTTYKISGGTTALNDLTGDIIITSVDLTNPSVQLNFPINTDNLSSQNVEFSGNMTDLGDGLKNVTLYGSWGSGWHSNETKTVTGTANITNFTKTILDGTYNWNYYACDNNDNCGFSTNNNSFTIDTTPPNVKIVFPTNGLNSSNTFLDVNYTVKDTNLVSCWYSNDTHTINYSLSSCSNITSVNWTEGFHNVTVWANDTLFGNLNFSKIEFVIDSISPLAFFNSPFSGEIISNNPYNLNASSSTDSNTGTKNASFYYYNTTSSSWILIGNDLDSLDGLNYSWNIGLIDGSYEIRVNVSDWTSNIGTNTSNNVLIDLVNEDPSCTITYPNGNENVSGIIIITSLATENDPNDVVENVSFEYSSNFGNSWNYIGINTTTNLSSYSFSWDTSLDSDSENYLVRCNITDTRSGKSNDISNQNFTVDNTSPLIYEGYINTTNLEVNTPMCLNITVTDNIVGVDSVIAEINFPSGPDENITYFDSGGLCDFASGDNIYSTQYLPDLEGEHNWTYTYANDTLGNLNKTFTSINWSVYSNSYLITDMLYPLINIEINESGFFNNYTQNCNVTCNQSGGNCNDVLISAEYNPGVFIDITTGTTDLTNNVNNYSCGNLNSGESCNYTFSITSGIESGNNFWPIRCHGESSNAATDFSFSVNLHVNDKPFPLFSYPTNGSFVSGIENLNASNSYDNDGIITNYLFELDNETSFNSPTTLCNGASLNCTWNTSNQNECLEEDSSCYIRLTLTDNLSLTNSTIIQIEIDNIAPNNTIGVPENNSYINSESFIINASVTDFGSGPSCVEFDAYYDSSWNNLGINCTSPYQFLWDLSGINDQEGMRVRTRANDSQGNFGGYDIRENITHDTIPPLIDLIIPVNNTYSNNINQNFNFTPEDFLSGILNCSLILNEQINQTNSSVINNTNTQISSSGFGQGIYEWEINCTDLAGNTNSSESRFLYIDLSSPLWSNQNQTINGSFVSKVYRYQKVNLTALLNDSFLLNTSFLSTNESGSWDNKTQNYSSPVLIGLNESNVSFEWSNSSIIPGSEVFWKIYANDSASNLNVTEEMNFTVWGIAEIESILMNPSGITPGSNSTIRCVVIDNVSNEGIENYNITFYNETGIIGYNLTSTNGIGVFPTTSFPNPGAYMHGCNITNDPLKYYDVSLNNYSETFLGVGYGISTYAFESGSSQRAYEGDDVNDTTINTEIDDSYSDLTSIDSNLQDFQAGQGLYAYTRFEFFIDETTNNITRFNFTWVGSGDVGSGNDGYILYLYNYSSSSWVQQVSFSSNNSEQTENIIHSDLGNISDFINESNGEIMLLARTFSSAPTSGTPGNRIATIYTNFIELEVRYDVLAPEVNLTFPFDGTDSFGLSATLNFTASDEIAVEYCELWTNRSGLFEYEDTKIYEEGINNSFVISGFTENIEFIRWNVRCNDSTGNIGFTANDWYFNQVIPPDFTINNSEIYLYNTSKIIEGTNVTINSTIWNIGGQNSSVNISYYDGDPDGGGILISNDTIFVNFGYNNVSSINWTSQIGPQNIFVVLDPPIATNGSIVEINESNNEGNNSFDIPSWQEFYGNASINVLIGNNNLSNLSAWQDGSLLDGNIFVADQESNIEWNSLIAIGKNDTGTNSSNDFYEIDQILQTVNYSDSISNLYSISQIPKNVNTFTVSKIEIDEVPIINSTNNSNFVTGLLWDDSDDSNGEYDDTEKEDLVFVAKFNEQKQGAYGIYDYEINIPVRLRSYNTTEESLVYFYYELN